MTKNLKKSKLIKLLVFLVVPLIFFFVSLLTINDYGETTDEKFDQHIGEFYYYDWSKKEYDGLIKRFIPLQRNYGPLFDTIVVASNDILHKKLNIIKNPVASYHFPVIVVSTTAIAIVFLFAYYEWGAAAATLASLTLSFMPRFIGHSQNNLKDTPTMTFFALTVFFFYSATKKKNLIFYIFAGIFLGLTYAIKINALIILPIVCFWWLTDRLTDQKLILQETKKFFGYLLLSAGIAFITILIVWPYYRYNPAARFVETYHTFKEHVWNEYVLYLGQHYQGHDIPWHYPLVMFGVTTPVFYLLMLGAGGFFATYEICSKGRSKSVLLLLIYWLILPCLTQVLSGAPMYDGIRHFLVILPPMAILIGFSIWRLGWFIWKLLTLNKKHLLCKKILILLYCFFILFNFTRLFYINIRFHPYEVVYFNELIGGVKGAKGMFDLEYWGHSLKYAAEWINNNLPVGSKIWSTLPMEHHFPIDRRRFFLLDKMNTLIIKLT